VEKNWPATGFKADKKHPRLSRSQIDLIFHFKTGYLHRIEVAMNSQRKGFTLVELLIAIAVIGILAALLLSALGRAKSQTDRTQCASNLRQWGIALNAFAGDNDNEFPDNRDGAGVSWCSTNVQAFWEKYLIPMARSADDINRRSHVLFCPTEKWHRGADLLPPHTNDYGSQLAVGYFYLPYRDTTAPENLTHHADYNVAGAQGWVQKQKLGGPFMKAPIAMDEKQATEQSGDPATLKWFGIYALGPNPNAPVPFSSHVRPSGEPLGGNFLFEDGRVNWFKSPQIEVALARDDWQFYYKVQLD
jgi:prepilin-type N-terminal cleavage/methylation domain-containing protein